MREARVFTVPPGVPFLPTLADALLSGTLIEGWPDGPDLGEATVYLPTRRAGQALAAHLAERSSGHALLMPRIVPLGDADEEESPLRTGPHLPPAIPPLERRLVLTRLVQAWAQGVDKAAFGLEPDAPLLIPGSPADAVQLAADLEGLMDSLATEGTDWAALSDAVEIDYSRYFKLTLDFVRIAHEQWPAILAERGASDPARRRNAALRAEAARLADPSRRGPVIAAGSTGSVPATAALLAAIAHAPRGAVVLPGLDTDLDPAGWDAIGEEGGVAGHPQFMLRRLLEDHLKVPRDGVRTLGAAQGRATARQKLLSETMRPAETTDAWAAMPDCERRLLAEAGAASLTIVEASDEREEALAIAITLREALVVPGRRAALVTPDRALARRVAAELARWGIEIEDTAGSTLAETRPGHLARLVAEAVALDFAPVQLLALLAHPDVTLGWARADVERAAAALEIGALRGPEPRPGLAGVAAALALRRRGPRRHDPRPRQILTGPDWDLAAALVERLEGAFASFVPAGQGGTVDLVGLAASHAGAIAALTAVCGEAPPPSRAEIALATLFDDLAAAGGASIEGRFGDYPAFFNALARLRSLAPEPRSTHGRLRIFGLLEARLLDFDRVVLGGLDETVWPPAADTDAFLNRPMRLKLGLTPPERRVGQTAHDFAQLLGTADAIVTRAGKRDGKPTVPSRFLERLRAFAGLDLWRDLVHRGERYRALARRLDLPQAVAPLARPAPRPGASLFPRRLSVTEIETLVRDPYAIYARRILRLDPLDPIAVPPSAADRGTILHDVIATFTAAHPDALPANGEEILLQLGLDRFSAIADAYPELYALWWPAFRRLVPAYLEWERERRRAPADIAVERSGALEIAFGAGETFRLTGQADRIEIGRDGAAAIVDFKTGSVPSPRIVAVGFSPQLTLEAAMLMRGGFRDVPAATAVPRLDYVKIGGRAVIATQPVEPPRGDVRSLAEIVRVHLAGLENLVRRYGVEGAGYLSRPYAQYARAYAPYDHLARVGEWSQISDEEESEAS